MNAPLPPPTPKVQALLQQGMAAQRTGRLVEARRAWDEAHRLEPRRYDILHLLGMAAVQGKDMTAAVDFFRRAAKLAPQMPALQINLGNALVEAGRHGEALETLDRALALDPNIADAWNSRGAALRGQGSLGAAAVSYGRALELDPNNLNALCNLGGLLGILGRLDEGLAAYDRAAGVAPSFADAFAGRARLRLMAGRVFEALADADHALSLRPNLAEAHANRGFALETLGRGLEAQEAYGRARGLDAELAQKFLTRGLMLAELGHLDSAVVCYQSCLALDDGVAEAYVRLGQAYLAKAPDMALDAFDRALELAPQHDEARCLALAAAMACAEWGRAEGGAERLAAAVRAGKAVNAPFVFLTVSDSPADQLACAKLWAQTHFPPGKPLARGPYRHERLRVAYVSADYHAHATAWLTAGLFAAHDRTRYELFGISIDAAPEDDMRRRLKGAFEHFLEVAEQDDATIAQLIRDHEIDVLIDMKGYTAGNRPGIFARRPAPVQVQWLGYPGTMGAPYFDYVIADAQVIPTGEERCYSEAVVRLPGSYQSNDPARPLSPAPARVEVSLPSEGVVFCCFNAAYKITPAMFAVWMRLLQGAPGSVLWLLQDNPRAEANLKAQAAAAGVDPARLVFAPRAQQADHIARLQCADLVLDTLPYGAHTTASDALWAGVPVVTCRGNAFAGRVGASLLAAVGLPELIAEDISAYEALAADLAAAPERRAALRATLVAARRGSPLFDAVGFARHMERAFDGMQARKVGGRAAQGFDVQP